MIARGRVLILDLLLRDAIARVERVARGVLLAVDDEVFAIEQPPALARRMRGVIEHLAGLRRDDFLEIVVALDVLHAVAESLDDVAVVGPPFGFARVLDGVLARRRVAHGLAHREVEHTRQRVVLREAAIGVIRRARRGRTVDARTRAPDRG